MSREKRTLRLSSNFSLLLIRGAQETFELTARVCDQLAELQMGGNLNRQM